MNIEVSGGAIPRLTRRDISVFTRRVLLTLERLGRIEDEITDVSIAFVDDDAMKTLHRQFRHKNKTTDVLTVPADGTYQIALRYTAQASRPVSLSVGGREIRKDAAGEVTPPNFLDAPDLPTTL